MTYDAHIIPPEVDLDFGRFAEMGDDVLPRLAALRQVDPLAWSEANNCWIATGHDVVTEGFSGRLPLSAARHKIIALFFPDPVEREQRVGYFIHIFSLFLINLDPPAQSRLRKLLMGAFTRPVAERFRPYVRALTREVLDGLGDAHTIDFHEQVSRPITARTILQVLGLGDEHLAKMEYWARTLNDGAGGNPDRDAMAKANDALLEMRDLFEREITIREQAPDDGLISMFLAAREDDDRLTRDEVIAQLILVLVAGHDTTMNTMTLAIARLASLPEQRATMRDHPEKFEACIMELMRVIAMSAAMLRIVGEDFTWHGRALKQGQIVYLMIAGANRDPAVFANPEAVDFERPNSANMTFAPGRHFCIGHWFAKMVMSEVLPAFMARYDHWDMLEDHLRFGDSVTFRAPLGLPLRLHATDLQPA